MVTESLHYTLHSWKGTQMIPYTTLDSIIAQMPERTGHTLLDEKQGCVKGCRMGVSLYRSTEYHMPQKHDDQEGFFVLDGKGYALGGTGSHGACDQTGSLL